MIPLGLIPTYSSRVSESFLHRIPLLSESFIYSNDDFIFIFEGSAMGEGIFLSLKKGKNRAYDPSESPVIPSKLLV
ncbi:MAG: hypothetical protein HQ462_01980 [Deltaproteobacteria bacterium]|nr:hypothetical protein [Deltaproteobacteria bacterium]